LQKKPTIFGSNSSMLYSPFKISLTQHSE